MTRRSNYNLNLRKLRTNKVTRNQKAALNEKPTDSLHLQFNLTIHSFEDKGIFTVYDKDCRNF